MIDILLDACLDVLKLMPFLFFTYLGMEYIEHATSMPVLVAIQKAGNFGPLIGSFLGVIPQCGFSAAASGLYAGRVISLGTLIAIYMSTSDEMIPILLSEHVGIRYIAHIVVYKVLFGIIWGFLTDYVFFRNENASEHINIHGMCESEHCNCEKGIWKSSIKHTLQISAFIFIVTFALNLIIEGVGENALGGLILNHKIFGPLIASLVGLIPNCAASVVITELYLGGAIGFGSLIAGLLTGAGVGWLVLLRASKDAKKTLKVVALTYSFGAISGILINLFSIC